MRIEQISRKVKSLNERAKVKAGGGNFMDSLLKGANRYKQFIDLTIALAKKPGDEKIKQDLAENRRRSQASSQREHLRGSVGPIEELERVNEFTCEKMAEGFYLYSDNEDYDRKPGARMGEERRLLKTPPSSEHVITYRYLVSQLDLSEKAIKKVSRKDERGKEIYNMLQELGAICKELIEKYKTYFESTKQGRALIESGCI